MYFSRAILSAFVVTASVGLVTPETLASTEISSIKASISSQGSPELKLKLVSSKKHTAIERKATMSTPVSCSLAHGNMANKFGAKI